MPRHNATRAACTRQGSKQHTVASRKARDAGPALAGWDPPRAPRAPPGPNGVLVRKDRSTRPTSILACHAGVAHFDYAVARYTVDDDDAAGVWRHSNGCRK
ncbi:hypothetical protein IscW_ISCW022236 [Ixodes scapularis]|uniref:Uncharacterized protein n=1 Tax=Ixodes scapularis TaxID=6945 RepID=B7QEP1_IXOSC|nr:hypothetical protein IscW_ISCW022236 [Ixodes scapularis]|eukprot:XP_002414005.1 hypothetical protein IscW_ISCW022236 [Ixodes scapularis]